MSQRPASRQWRAIVIGGSIAGLLAARALAEFCAEVTIVERDTYPSEPRFRPGTPQARHVHVLLARGRELIEEFFPGITDHLLRHGAVRADMLGDVAFYQGAALLPRLPSRVWTILSTRSLLEWQIRRMLLERAPNVRILEHHEVTALVAAPGAGRVTGVRLRQRPTPASDAPSAAASTDLLDADLIIDASGRHSKAAAWLRALGYDAPTEARIDAHFGYATRVFDLPSGPAGRDWRGMLVLWNPPRYLSGGVIWPNEDGTWIVGLGGAADHIPPTGEDDFMAYAQSLPVPEFYAAIRDGTPLTPVYGYRDMANVRRYFERIPHLPEGFAVIGDTFCGFDPVYGQGMSVAAMEADLLRRILHQHTGDLTGFGRRFHRALAREVALPWQMATAVDIRVPGAEGATPGFVDRLMQRYLDRVTRLTPVMEQAERAFAASAHLVAPPSALFAPAIFLRALMLPPDSTTTPIATPEPVPAAVSPARLPRD